MAMGGSYKGNGSSCGHRGRPYGLMLLLAFGAALLGVMVLHKLRERRIFNLLLKEKDRDLISLQLLLQKEINHSKEMKRKNEEMKAKIYSLRTQKMELDRRILEKQSTIGSLKDEQKAMESALEEKQNEIKMLRVKEIDPGKENPHVIALMESLKQKEAEIEDLKHRLEYPVKVWSLSADDPSNPPVNSTMNGSRVGGQANTDLVSIAEEGKKLHESRYYIGGDNLSTVSEDRSKLESNNFRDQSETKERVEDGTGNLVGDTGRREMKREQMQKQGKLLEENINNGGQAIDKPIEDGQGSKNEDSQNGGSDFEGRRDKDIEVTEKLQNSQEPREMINKGGIKSEEPDNSGIIARMRGKHGHVSKTKAKRWRMLVKNRHNGHLENNEVVSMRNRRFFRGDQDGLKGRNEGAEREGGEMGVDNPMEESNTFNVSGAKLLKPKNPDTNHQREILENAQNSLNVQVLKNRSSNGETSNDTDDARTQKLEEGRRAEEHEASGIRQQTSSGDISEVDDNAEQVIRVGNTNTMPEELEDAKVQESQIVAADGDFFKESKSNAEGENQYKEETDESEF
ncbi:hypothetical protein F2P56_001876 [Juglans regia]|uniref:Uncharacterized protein LOC108983047 n=2 Tax=Juglans regia TaxID=51240 RepID=A0A2I4DSJ5_JUGRE|nr:uncharacterized protein LOC108983047 [Juglans regia]KAF5481207.1 hypothetical protein F2P56_001876 [Juglans regia]